MTMPKFTQTCPTTKRMTKTPPKRVCQGCCESFVGPATPTTVVRNVHLVIHNVATDGQKKTIQRGKTTPLCIVQQGLGCPRPQTGARIPISWKRGFRGPKKGPQWKWGFFVRRLPFPACVKAKGNGGFLFSRKWGFGPLFGVGGIPAQGSSCKEFLKKEHDFCREFAESNCNC